jgi:hypothetical protein
VYAVETSSRVDPPDRPARADERLLAVRSSDATAEEVPAAGVALEEDESLEWFVNLLLAENASKA